MLLRTRFTLWTIWCCFLARAWFYCAAVPLWEGYDEYSHFALIQYVATNHGRFPLGAVPPNSSRQVGESRRLTPAAWMIHDAAGGLLSYEEFFDLPVAERNARRARLESLPQEWSRQEADPKEPLYEAQQAPLYYWIMAPFYGLIQGWSLPSAVWILRSLTALMASAAIPLAFFVGRRVMRDDALALGAAVVVASFPEFLILIGHVGNEGLSAALGGLFVLVALGTLRRKPSAWSGVWLGTALGAALLTKAYFLALVPLAVAVLWLSWRRDAASHAGAARQAAAALGTAMAIGAWWYLHNLVVKDSLAGQFDVQGTAGSQLSLLDAAGQIRWIRVVDMIAISHIWLGDWSFLVVRTWMYRLVELTAILAVIGVCAQTVRTRLDLPRPRDLWLLALASLAMIAGLCFHAAQVFRANGPAAAVGYYLYALVAPEAILLVAGLARLMPVRLRLLPVPLTAFILIGIEQFGAWFLMLPYYAGFIRHNATGLPAARVQQYMNGGQSGNSGLRIFFERISAIGPVSSPAVIETAAVLYGLATALLLWSAYRIFTSASAPQKPHIME